MECSGLQGAGRGALLPRDRAVFAGVFGVPGAGNRCRRPAGSGIPRFAVPEYIVRMRRSPLSRVTGLVLATLVGISAPGLALAHGYAHHEAREHAEHEHGHEHQHATPAAHESESSADHVASIESTGSSGDHHHPELSLGLSTRAEIPLFVVPSAVTLPEYVLVESRASLLLTAAPPRAGPPDAAPRQPRAPPFA